MNNNMSNTALLTEIGSRLKSLRVAQNKDQQQFAYEAGLSLRTLSRLENGHSVSFEAVLKVRRALGLTERLDLLIPTVDISPVEQARNKRSTPRQRASGRRKKPDSTATSLETATKKNINEQKKSWSGFKKTSTFESHDSGKNDSSKSKLPKGES